MPTSDLNHIESVLGPLVYLAPTSILDIGPGFGKYGLLAREFLDIWGGDASSLQRENWRVRIEGIEVFPRYLSPVHDYIYDAMHVGDASKVLPALEGPFDLVLLIDVLEHFDRDEGGRVLKQCLRLGRNLLVSVPRNLGEQGEAFGNPHERHLAGWGRSDLEALGPACFVPNADNLIACIGPDALALRRTLRYVRLRKFIRRHAPFLRFVYRRMKKKGDILPYALR